MRFQHLFPLVAACIVVTLPLAASAAGLDGHRSQYLEACKTSAMAHQASEDGATKHCDCSANVVDKKFTQQEIAQVNDGTAPATLIDRLTSEVRKACATAK